MPGAPKENGVPRFTPQWKPAKPYELQFQFFEDQELRKPLRVTIDGTNKRSSNSPPDMASSPKKMKL